MAAWFGSLSEVLACLLALLLACLTSECCRECWLDEWMLSYLLCRHDSTKRAVCTRWLRGCCQAGALCPLQHQRKPELMPVCIHFLKA